MKAQGFAIEREELGWYFAGVGPAVGLRAAAMEVGSHGIYDAMASHMAHMARRDPAHRAGVARLERVRKALGFVPYAQRRTLELAFTPFGAGRATYRLLSALAHEGQPLVALAVETRALLKLWRARFVKAVPEYDAELDPIEVPSTELLQLLEDEVSALRRGNRIPTGHRLNHVLQEASTRCEDAVGFYADVRRSLHNERAAERRADNAAFLARQLARMLGEA